MDCPRCNQEMKPHRRQAPSRGPFRTADTRAVLLWCRDCDVTIASEDARQYLGLDVVSASGWRPIERWREKLKQICPRHGCDARMYRVCSRHGKSEVAFELCPACKRILFDGEGYDTLAEIIESALAAPKLDRPKPIDFVDHWVSDEKK